MQRILLCSMAVPWPERPLLCGFHHDQARALADVGVDMRLFSPAPAVPWPLRFVHDRFRRHIDRPVWYEQNGALTESPRCAFAFPPMVRHRLAASYPEQVARWARAAMGKALRRTIERYRPDALLGHGLMPWGRLLQQVAAEVGVPFSILEHSAADVMRLQPNTPLLAHYADVAADARDVLCVGAMMSEHLHALGIANARLVPNGTRLPTREQLVRRRPAEIEGKTVVLSAANYQRRKGFEELLAGFADICAAHDDAVLVLVTQPGPELQRALAACDLGDRVMVLPPMAPRALTQWMLWADLFAMPSWSEAFGLVYVEALAAGTPVLMTQDCGLAWQLSLATSAPSRDQHGWMVASGSREGVATALRDALADPARLAAMGQAGREFVCARFTWAENARQVLASFEGSPAAHDAQPKVPVAACR